MFIIISHIILALGNECCKSPHLLMHELFLAIFLPVAPALLAVDKVLHSFYLLFSVQPMVQVRELHNIQN